VLVGCDLICAVCVAAVLLPGMPLAGMMALRGRRPFGAPLGIGVGGPAAECMAPQWAVVGAGVIGTGCVLAAVRAVWRCPAGPNPEMTMADM